MANVRKLKPDDPKSPWIVEYTDAGGARRRKTPKSGLKKDAEVMRSEIEAELRSGLHVPDSRSATISAAIDLFLEACEHRVRVRDKLRPRTLRCWRSNIEHHVRPQIGDMRIN